jgi:hypothetical protein
MSDNRGTPTRELQNGAIDLVRGVLGRTDTKYRQSCIDGGITLFHLPHMKLPMPQGR